jgi:hypothetical protein
LGFELFEAVSGSEALLDLQDYGMVIWPAQSGCENLTAIIASKSSVSIIKIIKITLITV